jgi:hypothetical protein
MTLGDHLDPAVLEVGSPPHEPKFQSPCPGPPAKAHSLHTSRHPHCDALVLTRVGSVLIRCAATGHHDTCLGTRWQRGHR